MRRSKEAARHEAGRLLWRYAKRPQMVEGQPPHMPTKHDYDAALKEASKRVSGMAADLVVLCETGQNVRASELARAIQEG